MTLNGANFSGNGSPVSVNNDNLTLTDCTLTSNTAQRGGAVYALNGSVTVTGCVISTNTATNRRGGGIHALNATVTVQDSSITGNTAVGGGGGGLFLRGTGVKTLRNSNISGNSGNYGGGVYFRDAAAGSVVENCTLTGNTGNFNAMGNANAGGGGAVLLYNGSLTVRNCTITGNTAPNTAGGGIKVKNNSYGGGTVSATLNLISTIVSGNSDASGANEISRFMDADVVLNASNNLIQTAPVAGTINGTNTANITGQDPLLGPLQDNGGPTLTRALSPTSPAINQGSNPGSLTTDQRGTGFARTSGTGTDIGAFEVQVPSVTGVSPQSGPTSGGTTVTITGVNFTGATAVLFGGVPATTFTVTSPTTITATTPAGAGTVDVIVTTPQGTSPASANAQFTYVSPVSPPPVSPPPVSPPPVSPPPVSPPPVSPPPVSPPPVSPPPAATPLPRTFSAGGASTVRSFNANATDRATFTPFPGFAGGVRVAEADFNGDGVADVLAGTGPGTVAQVRLLDGVTGAELFSIAPFAGFVGGVYVAAGDITGDGVADIVITPDEGGGPRVRVFDGRSFTQIADFFGIDDPAFRGGARAATGDFNGDGFADLVVAAGFGGGPRVAIFDGKSLTTGAIVHTVPDFFAFEQGLRNGAFVAAGDVNGDGRADLIGGGGPGGGPRVKIVDGAGLLSAGNVSDLDARPDLTVANFFGGDPDSRGGIRVAAKNLDGDTRADLVVGAGENAGSRVTGYLATSLTAGSDPAESFRFDAFPGENGGVFVG
jgi:hypothetical protein